MFYLPLAILTWLCIPWLIDRSRLSGLLVYGLFGSVLSTIQDRLMLVHRLWEYHDSAPVSTHAQIALLISLSAAPVFGIRFAQGLRRGAPVPWRRVAKYTAVSMLPEIAAWFSGNIRYYNGWSLFWSVAAYIPIWLSFWGLHRWLEPAPPLPATTSPSTQAFEG